MVPGAPAEWTAGVHTRHLQDQGKGLGFNRLLQPLEGPSPQSEGVAAEVDHGAGVVARRGPKDRATCWANTGWTT
jgi:hypothetical protein